MCMSTGAAGAEGEEEGEGSGAGDADGHTISTWELCAGERAWWIPPKLVTRIEGESLVE